MVKPRTLLLKLSSMVTNTSLSNLQHSRERRIKNERLFLDLNQRIKRTASILLDQAQMSTQDLELRFACECSNVDCLEEVMLSVRDFDQIHARSGYYLLVKGHAQLDIERVVTETADYAVVRKFI